MKRFAPIIQLCLLMFIFSSCERETFMLTVQTSGTSQVFQAQIENLGDTLTKVYADSQMRVLWNAGDVISIFNKNTYNQPYCFTGQDGANAGGFTKVDTDDEFSVSEPMSLIHAVYPYDKSTSISYDGDLSVILPGIQHNKENSFGIGANTMVSVVDNTMLQFKNVGGYLSFKFYGDGVSVKSITLRGNNHEKIAGDAKVTMTPGSLPSVEMLNTATEEISLVCDEPVALNASAVNYNEFWFVVPPTTFTEGFTVTLTDTLGRVFTQSTAQPITISRNNLSRMAVMLVVPKYSFVPFVDSKFKAYCVENFDEDGDGEISMEESNTITRIEVTTTDITSMGGIEFFPNLTYLSCCGERGSYNPNDPEAFWTSGKLTELDVSKNTKLEYLNCSLNYISSLDVSNNRALIRLYCTFNKMYHLILGEKPVIENISCGYTYLKESIDPSSFTNLKVLSCDNANVKSLDVSNLTNLQTLSCYGNHLSSLDVSKNTALERLECGANQLSSLNVSNNTALKYLECGGNLLTTLDVTNNNELSDLRCAGNCIESLYLNLSAPLTVVYCGSNQLSGYFDVSGCQSLSYLDISSNPGITSLKCTNCSLEYLYIAGCTSLNYLNCDHNKLEALNLSKNTKLKKLNCAYNNISELDVSNNVLLEDELDCSNNDLSSLDVSNNTLLKNLNIINNPNLSVLWLKTGQSFDVLCYDANITTIRYKEGPFISFADNNIKAICVAHWDTDKDGVLSYLEADAVTSFENYFTNNTEITTFDEMIYFHNVKSLADSAFYGCSHLSRMNIPDQITSIGNGAFLGCQNLEYIKFGAGVSSIGNSILNPEYIRTLEVSENNQKYDSRNKCNSLIETATNTLLYGGRNTTIPEGVENIAADAFYGSRLINFTLPSTLKHIGQLAFGGYNEFKHITCLAPTPPVLDFIPNFSSWHPFLTGWFMSYETYIYVPDEYFDAYQAAWGSYQSITIERM